MDRYMRKVILTSKIYIDFILEEFNKIEGPIDDTFKKIYNYDFDLFTFIDLYPPDRTTFLSPIDSMYGIKNDDGHIEEGFKIIGTKNDYIFQVGHYTNNILDQGLIMYYEDQNEVIYMGDFHPIELNINEKPVNIINNGVKLIISLTLTDFKIDLKMNDHVKFINSIFYRNGKWQNDDLIEGIECCWSYNSNNIRESSWINSNNRDIPSVRKYIMEYRLNGTFIKSELNIGYHENDAIFIKITDNNIPTGFTGCVIDKTNRLEIDGTLKLSSDFWKLKDGLLDYIDSIIGTIKCKLPHYINFDRLMTNNTTIKITFVKDLESESQEYHVEVLKQASQYFRKLLEFKQLPNQEINDIPPSIGHKILKSLYTNVISISNDDFFSLFKILDMFDMNYISTQIQQNKNIYKLLNNNMIDELINHPVNLWNIEYKSILLTYIDDINSISNEILLSIMETNIIDANIKLSLLIKWKEKINVSDYINLINFEQLDDDYIIDPIMKYADYDKYRLAVGYLFRKYKRKRFLKK